MNNLGKMKNIYASPDFPSECIYMLQWVFESDT